MRRVMRAPGTKEGPADDDVGWVGVGVGAVRDAVSLWWWGCAPVWCR